MIEIPYLAQDEIDKRIETLHCTYGCIEQTAESANDIVTDCMNALGGSLVWSSTDCSQREIWFFRVRTKASFKDKEEIFCTSQHTYTPPARCTDQGRCNLAGFPVFYGSGSPLCAIKEMKNENERNYILSIWRLPPQKHLITFGFFNGGDLTSTAFKAYNEKSLDAAYEQFSVNRVDDQGNLRRIIESWSNIFVHEKYGLSASIAHQILYGTPGEGNHRLISFPSVQTREDANYVMHPDLADSMELHRIVDVEVDPSRPENPMWLQVCDGSELVHGRWRPTQSHDFPVHDPRMPHKAL